MPGLWIVGSPNAIVASAWGAVAESAICGAATADDLRGDASGVSLPDVSNCGLLPAELVAGVPDEARSAASLGAKALLGVVANARGVAFSVGAGTVLGAAAKPEDGCAVCIAGSWPSDDIVGRCAAGVLAIALFRRVWSPL